MDHPDQFENERNDVVTTHDVGQNETAEQAEAAVPETEPAQESAPVAEEPHWYGISYAGDSVETPVPHKSNGKLLRRIALVAVCFALCIAISAVSVFIGFYYARSLAGYDDTAANAGNYVTGTETGRNANTTAYSAGDAAAYDYADTTLDKNDGSTLAGSRNGSAGDNVMTAIEVVAAVKDSVVEITTTTTSSRGRVSAGAGSGVIIHADGIIVTNNHVIDGVSTIYVRLTNGNTYEAYLRGTDEEADIAVLKIEPHETLTVAKLGYSGALAVGEEVIAIGNPLGELGGTVTNGIISALERAVEVEGVTMTLLQTNAAINAGNSGGGLFNMAGELIGVVNAKYAAEGVEGLGFAIPIDTAAVSINALMQYGYIPGRPSLGATVQEVQVRNGYFSVQTVLYVYDAGTSGLQKGDYILAADGTELDGDLATLKSVIRSHAVGDAVTLRIYRNNQTITVQVTLVEYVPERTAVNFGG